MSEETKQEVTKENVVDEDFHDSMMQIEMLFQSHILSFGYKEYTLENYADRRVFAEWKAREGCRDTDEMRSGLNIDGILRSGEPSEGEALTYLQYVINIAELSRRAFNREQAAGYDFDIRNYTLLLTRVREFLKKLNYDYRYVEDKEFIFIVPHDAALNAVIPETPSDPVYGALTEYRSTSVFGNLQRKKELLLQLGRTVESYPDNLKYGNEILYSRIAFLLDSLSIRPGEDDAAEAPRIANMDAAERENWYDETFHMLLVRILNRENVGRMERVDELADECGTGIEEVTSDEIDSIVESLSESSDVRPERKKQAEIPVAPEVEALAAQEALDRQRVREVPSEEPQEVRRKGSGSSSGNRMILGRAIAAIVVADILFILFLMYYFHLI